MTCFSRQFLSRSVLALCGLVLSGMALPNMALADDEAMADCIPVNYPPYQGKIPANFTQIPTCANAPPEDMATLAYAFKGKATVSGEVVYSDTETWGARPDFAIDKKSLARLPEMIMGFTGFRLTWHSEGGVDGAISKFHLPPLEGNGKNCWRAPATIEVTRIYMLSDDGDGEGIYIPEYRVLRVGKFSRCRAETDMDVPPGEE